MASWREDGEGPGAAREPYPLGPARGILTAVLVGIAAWLVVVGVAAVVIVLVLGAPA